MRSILLLKASVLISYRVLIDKVLELNKMLERATWKRILENEEDKTKIEETFKHIDEHTKNFHVRLSSYLHQSTKTLMPFPSSNSC